jgi:hypothetical protein
MNADFSTAQAGEKRLRLIGAGFVVRIAFAVIDLFGDKVRV